MNLFNNIIFYYITLLSLLKSISNLSVSNLSISIFSTLLFKLLKSVSAFFNSSIFNLSTSAFKLTKSDFAANLEVSILVAFF